MTGDIFDLEAARRRITRAKQKQRPPEFGLDIWVEDGHLDTLSIHGDQRAAAQGPQALELMVDAAFLYAREAPGCQPVLWILCDGTGHTDYLVPPNLFDTGGWRRGWWLLKVWARVSLRMWGYAWRMARGAR